MAMLISKAATDDSRLCRHRAKHRHDTATMARRGHSGRGRRGAWSLPRLGASGHARGDATGRCPRLARRTLGWVVGGRHAIPGPGFADQFPSQIFELGERTLRQIVRLSAGGQQLRIRLANTFGEAPIVVGAASVALPDHDEVIDQASARGLTFSGLPGVTIPAGAIVLSDPVELSVPNLTELAVGLYFPLGHDREHRARLGVPNELHLVRRRLYDGGGPPGRDGDADRGSFSPASMWLWPHHAAPSSALAIRSRTARSRRRTRIIAGQTSWPTGSRHRRRRCRAY